MSLPRFSVENPVLVNMFMWVLIVAGAVIALTMTREMFPEFRPQKLVITTVHPGVSPQDIEKSITLKIEEAVRDVTGVERPVPLHFSATPAIVPIPNLYPLRISPFRQQA